MVFGLVALRVCEKVACSVAMKGKYVVAQRVAKWV